MVSVSVGHILGSKVGQRLAGLAIDRKRHGSLERLNRDSFFQIFTPQQKFLLVGQRATPALIEDNFLQESVAAITSECVFRALLMNRFAKLVEMG